MEKQPVTKMEFAVQMTCTACEEDIRQALRGAEGVQRVYVNAKEDLVLVETILSAADVQKLLETTGRLVLFRGFGSAVTTTSQAAVAILNGDEVKGLVRFLQVDEEKLIVDGTADGLEPGNYYVRVRQFGDLSQGYVSCGDVFSTSQEGVAEGELGSVQVGELGRAEFHYTSSNSMKVLDIIGRSISIESDSKQFGVCAVIARSSGIFQNTKKFCTCDGVSLWDEAKKNLSNNS